MNALEEVEDDAEHENDFESPRRNRHITATVPEQPVPKATKITEVEEHSSVDRSQEGASVSV